MKKNNKFLSVLLLLVLCFTCLFLTACDNGNTQEDPTPSSSETVKVTFKVGEQEQSLDCTVGSTVTLPTIPTKKGYDIVGWCTEIEGETVVWTEDMAVLSSDFTLVATYEEQIETYQVEYELNGGSFTTEDYPTSYTSAQLMDSIKLPTPAKEGYNFLGWYTTSSCTGTVHTVVDTYDQTDLKYYAKWEIKTYVLRYYTEGGLTSNNLVKVEYTANTKSITLPTATRAGFTFGGWYENASCDGEQVTAFDVSIQKNITLYAKWTANSFTLEYESNGGETISNRSYVTSDGIFDLPTPTKAGYYFAGWYDNASLTGAAMWQWRSTKAQSTTLYAKWSSSAVSKDGILPAHEDTVFTDVVKIMGKISSSTAKLANGYYDTSTPVVTTTGDYVRKINFYKYNSDEDTGAGIRLNNTTTFPETGYDWRTNYNAITFWAYSEKATNAQFGIILIINNNPFTYKRFDVTINWTGWKQVTLTFDTASGGGSGGTWANGFLWGWITTDGWGYSNTGTDDTIVYFDDLYLINQTSPYTVQPEDISTDDITQVKDRLRELLIGNEDVNTRLSSRISYSQSKMQSYIKYMDTTSTTNLWPDIGTVVSSGENIQTHYERILQMAQAYGTYGSDCYKDSKLYDAIVKALDWMYNNAYNENTASSGNWWQWQIGAPEALVKALLILEDDLNTKNKGHIELYLKGVDHFTPQPAYSYANRTWTGYVAFASSLLQNDKDQIIKNMQLMLSILDYTTSEDGFYADGSFIQHRFTAYLGGYGSNYLNEGTQFLYAILGTKLAYTQDYVDRFFDIFFNSYVPFVYSGHTFCFLTGRNISGNAANSGRGWYSYVFKLVPYANEEDQQTYYNCLAREMKLSGDKEYVYDNMSLICLDQYNEFMENYNAGEYDDTFNPYAKICACEDRVLQITSTYEAALALSSTRIYRYESINGANQNGWYEGDGVLYLYSKASDFGSDYWTGMNYYRFPGITCTDAERQEETQNTTDDSPFGSYAFVGSASNDANNPLYNVTVMMFGADTHAKVSKVCGYDEDVIAYKTYFMFDDEVVCIGTGIYSSTDSNVYTVVDNRLIQNAQVFINGSTTKTALSLTDTVSSDVSTIFVNSFGGYYFVDPTDVTLCQNGKHLEILISHGSHIDGETYAYVMLPNMTSAEVKAYGENPDIEVLNMDTECIAVKEKNLNMTGYVFFESDVTCGNVTSKSQCTCMVTENEDGTLTVTASDPTQLLDTVSIAIKGTYTSDNEDVTVTYKNGKSILTFNTKGMRGASITTTLSK